MKTFFCILFLICFVPICFAEINIDILTEAIYISEGGAKTSHPYGILKKYKHTTPKQACINTIKHALRDFKGDKNDAVAFIKFLGNRYAPINSDTDNGTNQYWIPNVTWTYQNMYSRPCFEEGNCKEHN